MVSLYLMHKLFKLKVYKVIIQSGTKFSIY